MRSSWVWAVAGALGCSFNAEGTGEAGGASATASGGASTGATPGGSDAGTAGSGGANTQGSDTQGSDTTTMTAGTTGTEPTTTDDASSGPVSAGSSGTSVGTTGMPDGSTGANAECHPLIAEILPSNVGSDDGLEWAKLYNPCPNAVDLTVYSLGWGGAAFGSAVDLQGSLPAGSCFVIGGPGSDSTNANPSYDQVHNYEPNLSRDPGAMLLYDVAAGSVDVQTVPLDCVVWGSNSAGYLDPQGAVAAVALPNPAIEVSVQRADATNWATGSPSPNACPTF